MNSPETILKRGISWKYVLLYFHNFHPELCLNFHFHSWKPPIQVLRNSREKKKKEKNSVTLTKNNKRENRT